MTEPNYAAAPSQQFDSFAEFYQNSAYSEFQQEHRRGGSLGLNTCVVSQEPFDLVDTPIPELVLARTLDPIELALCDFGDGAFQSKFSCNNIVITPPNAEARFCITAAHRLHALSIPAGVVETLVCDAGIDSSSYLNSVGMFPSRPDIVQTMRAIWYETSLGHRSNQLLIDGLTLQLLGQLCRDQRLSPSGHARADTRIARVIDYIESHLSEPLAVSELADLATMSVGHFTRCFKATMGEATWDYVLRRRCEEAKSLLLQTRTPLITVALSCGFSSQSHMTTCIKQHFGATPGAIRREASE